MAGSERFYPGQPEELAVIQREVACLSLGQPVRTATRRCLLTHSKHAFAPTSARFASRVWTMCLRTSARTAAVDLFPDQSDRRGTGKATIFLGRTLRVPRSSIRPLIRKFMLGSRQPSRPYRLTNDRGTKMTATRLTRSTGGFRQSEIQNLHHTFRSDLDVTSLGSRLCHRHRRDVLPHHGRWRRPSGHGCLEPSAIGLP